MRIKFVYLLVVALALVVVGCEADIGDDAGEGFDEEIYFCETNADCVPLPGCHPMECINSQHTDRFEQPEACTMIFMCEAAYNQEDCGCVNNRCANLNFGRMC